MKVEWVTHCEEGNDTRVIIKCEIPQQISTKWKKLIEFMKGRDSVVGGFNRFKTPIDLYREKPEILQALHDNQKSPKELMEQHKQQSKERQRQKEAKEKTKKEKKQDMIALFMEPNCIQVERTTASLMQRDWSTHVFRDLMEYSLLEAHRRILCLEGLLVHRHEGGLVRMAFSSLSELRNKAMAPKRYIIVDPLTMCVPFLFNRVLGDSVRDIAVHRYILVYGEHVDVLTRAQEPGDPGVYGRDDTIRHRADEYSQADLGRNPVQRDALVVRAALCIHAAPDAPISAR